MVPLENLAAFALAALALAALPGPSVLFIIGRSLSLGRAAGLLSVVGNASGMALQVAAVAAGIGALVASSIVAFTIIKFVGAAYLIYLGVQAIRHRNRVTDADSRATPRTLRRVYGEAVIVGVSNPKSIVFFVAILPQFVSRGSGSVPLQLAELGVVFLLFAVAFDSIWALTAGQARAWFATNPRRLSRLGSTGGVLMIGLGGGLALTGNKS
ncbi:LysE family translocator [Agreia sp. VKM Ac-1783]|uniref:LysE family translocator n=1 Tax=Agreia sp. VKM Ac-1783 TaxID=1938889 RepID=UPI000A2AC1E5|nr:LysE family translocator [Agreia sp. VKM Ac-1783]SMQ74068.1 Threonine/homoserine/homoserine lactone efflux protein [Agreia sp. VKM Ac-1783]